MFSQGAVTFFIPMKKWMLDKCDRINSKAITPAKPEGLLPSGENRKKVDPAQRQFAGHWSLQIALPHTA